MAAAADGRADLLAEAYARALLALLPTDELAEQAAGELERLVEMLDRVTGFRAFLARAAAGDEGEQEALYERASRAMTLLRAIGRQVRRRLDERAGKVEVSVTSAVALDAAQRRRIAAALGAVAGAPVSLVPRVDPALLGGLVVRLGDRVYDASVAGELRRLRQRLEAGRTPP
jgi:F-type H+-transporting ATPase subunit delta